MSSLGDLNLEGILPTIAHYNFQNPTAVQSTLRIISSHTKKGNYQIKPYPGSSYYYYVVDECLLPINIQGSVYYFPIGFTLPWNFPQEAPGITLLPTGNLVLDLANPSVKPDGTVVLTTLTNWKMNPNMEYVFTEMLHNFQQKSPLRTRSTKAAPVPASSSNVLASYSTSSDEKEQSEFAEIITELATEHITSTFVELNQDFQALSQGKKDLEKAIVPLEEALQSMKKEESELDARIAFYNEKLPQIKGYLDTHPAPDASADILVVSAPSDKRLAKQYELKSRVEAFDQVLKKFGETQFSDEEYPKKMICLRQLAKQHLKDVAEYTKCLENGR
ncbi:Vacuolar Protein Sorting 23B (Vps23) [Monocercomonoides exilis]|uniref:Vacuolar Protein Sorting 23B (Vps23) n=1 Tax=Monocercomonoides exilis TaxID=2049356 RepID=UPI00355A3745|nr:Vacuolar Protein Sorting 23B (Vps23) [Monocercomonoides exilis]|eukprot:MONOS_12517.1-p1 / transcript=MONOS_12517.1 / gene=MONOS_12517 / organism=Monocercomonoides_exilis_PA203 / gene_product=Vacuolar Protein Sorting 23B (Vps23), putative / transcript_product=Vacuolar Protein Sorting 23B (Vps23), putative / location=Mono_scaffold00697:14848-16502(-) / protein_length=333 / sequence_SO=supercontig / SO=protein_coding / is_pseudo=false